MFISNYNINFNVNLNTSMKWDDVLHHTQFPLFLLISTNSIQLFELLPVNLDFLVPYNHSSFQLWYGKPSWKSWVYPRS